MLRCDDDGEVVAAATETTAAPKSGKMGTKYGKGLLDPTKGSSGTKAPKSGKRRNIFSHAPKADKMAVSKTGNTHLFDSDHP